MMDGGSQQTLTADAPTPCRKEIAALCPHLQGPACTACVAKHSAVVTPKCPTPGQIDAACGTDDEAKVLGCIFPMPAGQGASWNRSLVRKLAAAIAKEARASGADRGFSPELQVATDPRFGRTQENFGGDPLLVSELGVAVAMGSAGAVTNAAGILSCSRLKHHLLPSVLTGDMT